MEEALEDHRAPREDPADEEPGRVDPPADEDAVACRNCRLNNTFLIIYKLRDLYYKRAGETLNFCEVF